MFSQKFTDPWFLPFSSLICCAGFVINQIEIKTWLDVFILAPLILYGFKKTHYNEERDPLLYQLNQLVLSKNYYFGVYDIYFLILWYDTAVMGTSK